MGMPAHQAMGLQRAIFGTRYRDPVAGGSFEEGRVHHIDAAGMWFTRPNLDNGKHVFGPAPLSFPEAAVTAAAGTGPHAHTIPMPQVRAPAAGDRCLVVWVVGVGTRDLLPWCLAWWPK